MQLKVKDSPSIHTDKTQVSFCKDAPITSLSATSDDPSAVIQWFDTPDINANPLAKGTSFAQKNRVVIMCRPSALEDAHLKGRKLKCWKIISPHYLYTVEFCNGADQPKIDLVTDKSNTIKCFDNNNQALSAQRKEKGNYYVQAFNSKGSGSDRIELKIIKKQAPKLSVTSEIDYYFYGDRPKLSFKLDPPTKPEKMTNAKLKTSSGKNHSA